MVREWCEYCRWSREGEREGGREGGREARLGVGGRGYTAFLHNYLDHPYFAPRSGFVRAKIKYQGLVATLRDEGKTWLTWLANMDTGGMVPSAFTNGLLVGYMASTRSCGKEAT